MTMWTRTLSFTPAAVERAFKMLLGESLGLGSYEIVEPFVKSVAIPAYPAPPSKHPIVDRFGAGPLGLVDPHLALRAPHFEDG